MLEFQLSNPTGGSGSYRKKTSVTLFEFWSLKRKRGDGNTAFQPALGGYLSCEIPYLAMYFPVDQPLACASGFQYSLWG